MRRSKKPGRLELLKWWIANGSYVFCPAGRYSSPYTGITLNTQDAECWSYLDITMVYNIERESSYHGSTQWKLGSSHRGITISVNTYRVDTTSLYEEWRSSYIYIIQESMDVYIPI